MRLRFGRLLQKTWRPKCRNSKKSRGCMMEKLLNTPWRYVGLFSAPTEYKWVGLMISSCVEQDAGQSVSVASCRLTCWELQRSDASQQANKTTACVSVTGFSGSRCLPHPQPHPAEGGWGMHTFPDRHESFFFGVKKVRAASCECSCMQQTCRVPSSELTYLQSLGPHLPAAPWRSFQQICHQSWCRNKLEDSPWW